MARSRLAGPSQDWPARLSFTYNHLFKPPMGHNELNPANRIGDCPVQVSLLSTVSYEFFGNFAGLNGGD